MKSDPITTVVLAHFQKVDPDLYLAACSVDFSPLTALSPSEYFSKLCRDIIAQQLSGRVAEVILERFKNLLDQKVNPDQVLAQSDQELRDVGMSWAKVKYLKDLAKCSQEKTLNFDTLHILTDEDVIKHLTQVKGIGRWTAEMFLMFTLAREDIFSWGDLGLRNGLAKVFGFTDKVPSDQLQARVASWSPFRSYASLVLWGVLDNGKK